MEVTFIEQMRVSFIPAIERMIEKERAHLARLKANRHLRSARAFIQRSTQDLAHYEHRLKEYRDYVRAHT